MPNRFYKAEHVLATCPGMTRRKLDYWVETGVIQPSRVLETNRRRRKYFLFSFDDLVRIRIVDGLRRSGVSLESIRRVVARLTRLKGKRWQRAWLVTDGRNLYQVTNDPSVLESLSRKENGQMLFAIVAVGDTIQSTNTRLRERECTPVNLSRYDATSRAWRGSRSRRKVAGIE